MNLRICIEFPDYESISALTAQMARSNWAWTYNVYGNVPGYQINIEDITCHGSLNDLRKMIKNVLKGVTE